MEKKKQPFDMLDEIPKAKTIIAWKLARRLEEKESIFVPNKPPSRPVNPSMFSTLLSLNKELVVSQRTIINIPRKRRRIVDSL